MTSRRTLHGDGMTEPEVRKGTSSVRLGEQALAAQPAELATAYVMLADLFSSYTSGTTVAVTGGKPFI
jgi:hypothetical protein